MAAASVEDAAEAPTSASVEGAWSRPILAGKRPPARGGHSGTLLGNLLVIFGGTYFEGDSFTYLKDLWVIDTETMTWYKPRCKGRPPGARYGHTATAIGTRIYIFGGRGESGLLYNDLHCLDVENWVWCMEPSTTAPPLGRFGHAAAAAGDKLVIFGGWDGRVAYNDVWVYDTPGRTWMKPTVEGTAPIPRHGHSLTPTQDGTLIVFGGWSVGKDGLPTYHCDVRELNLETLAWRRPRVLGDPPPERYAHGAVVSGPFLVVLGGWGYHFARKAEEAAKEAGSRQRPVTTVSKHDDTWLLDLERWEWHQPVLRGRAPPLLYGHSLSAMGPYILAWGGWDGVKPSADILQLDLSPVVGFLEDEPRPDTGADEEGTDQW